MIGVENFYIPICVFEHTPENDTYDFDAKSSQTPYASPGRLLQEICAHVAANDFESIKILSDFGRLIYEGVPIVEVFIARVAEASAKMQ